MAKKKKRARDLVSQFRVGGRTSGQRENVAVFNRPKTQDKVPHWWKNTPENGKMDDDDS